MEDYVVEPTASPYDENLYPFMKNAENKMHEELDKIAQSKSLDEIDDWEETPIKQNTDLDSIDDWIETPVNIPSYNIQDLDTGEYIIAPATMDYIDVKYNQAIQDKNREKGDFWGKVDAIGDSIEQYMISTGNCIEDKINSFTAGVVGGFGGIYDTALHYLYDIPKLQKQKEDANKSGDLDKWWAADRMLVHLNNVRNKNQKYINKVQEILRPSEKRDSVDNFIMAVGNAGVTTGTSIGAAFLTGNPAAAATLMGLLAGRMRYTELFDKSIKEGIDYYTADLYSTYGAMIEGGIEVIGDRIFFSAIKATPFNKAIEKAALANDTLVRAGRKIVNKQSVLLGFGKGFLTELGQESSQNILGAAWETAINDNPFDWGEIFEQSLAAAITGGAGGVVTTSTYNTFVDRFNDSFKEQVKELDPSMSEDEIQKIANAGQEVLLQVSDTVAEQLDYLASKEIEPDNLPDKNLNMSQKVRDIIKERYKLTDEEIDKISTVATRALNIRNEYNQATQYFYDKLVNAGIEAPQAAAVSRVFAAQAASNAIAEGISVKEAIDTQGFTFTKVEGEGKITKDELEDMIEGGRLFSFVGEKANLSEEQKTNLDEAKALEQDGLLNNKQIRQTTGWSRGDDNRWKLEISDKDATLTLNKALIKSKTKRLKDVEELLTEQPQSDDIKEYITKTKDLIKDLESSSNSHSIDYLRKDGGLDTTLGEILAHKKLFQAYPSFKDMNVIFSRELKDKQQAYYDARINTIFMEIGDFTSDELRKTLMHEVQHVIQREEGFARGGSTKEFTNPKMDLLDKVKWNSRIRYADIILGKNNWKTIDEAREKISKLENTDDEVTRENIERFKDADEYLKEYDKNTAFKKYEHLAGEIEARNTEKRIDLTEEERRKISPEETRDISRDDAIIKFDDGSLYKGSYNPVTKEIRFTESADVSTAIHEGMHGFEDNLRQRAKNGSKVAEQQINAMRDYVGSNTLDFTREQSEKLARAFERYALDGKAPNRTLKDTFDRFSYWLKNIYGTGEQLGKVSKDLKKAFREMLGGRKLDTALQLGEIIMNEKVREGKITQKEIGKKIGNILTWTKPRTENGKLVGRFPDKAVNDFFDNARDILSMPKDSESAKTKKQQASQKIAQNLGDIQGLMDSGEFALEDGRDIDDLVWENKLLSIAAGKADVSLMAEVYNSLIETYNEGRVGEKVKKEARKQRMTHLRDDAKSVLLQGKGKDWRKESSKLKQAGRRFGLIYQGWNGILDTLSMFDKTSKVGESKLNQDLNIFKEETKSRWGVYQDAEKLGGFLTKALGTGKSVSRYVNSTAKEKIKIEWGNNSKTFTRGQLIDIYMKSKDPETKKIMYEDNILQYNQEFMARVEENLTDEDVKVANALFDFYRDNYNKVNAFYENKYGISLGNKEFYSPRSMQSQAIDVRNGDLISGAAVSSFKQRTAKKGQIEVKDAFRIANDYINSTNHYIAFSDKLSELNSTLKGDPVIRNMIRNTFGNTMNNLINKEIERFATNNQKFLDAYDGVVSKVRSNYVVSVLGGRPSIAIKQLVSFPAYLEKMSTVEFVKGVAEFVANPLKAMQIIGNTEYMKTRGFDINQDFQKISKSEALKKFTTKRGFKDFLMLNVQMGDRGAIYIGGYALYKSELNKNLANGMSESEAKQKALDTVDRFTNETQQSSYMSEQSAFQRNPFLNYLTLFQTAQNQYFRKELGAIRGLATGRMNLGEAAKIIGIYHFLLPMLFQYVSDFGRWDWDNQKRAAIMGSFNGAFILSGILETGANWVVTGNINRHDTRLRDVLPVWSSIEEASKFGTMVMKLDYDDITLEDISDVLKQGAKSGGMLAGVPAKWLIDMGEIPDYIEDEEYGKAVGIALGWTPYALNKD